MKKVILLFLLSMFSSNLLGSEIKTVIPATMANIEGHKNLYKYGWSFITSTEETLEYISEKYGESQKALSEVPGDLSGDSKKLVQNLKKDTKKAVEFSKDWNKNGQKGVKDLETKGVTASKKLYQVSKNQFQMSYKKFVTGYITLSKRTKADREKLKSIPGAYFKNIKDDFSNLKELVRPFKKKFSSKVERSWSESFSLAKKEFDKEIKNSGKKSNTLTALPSVLWGHLKAFYYGLLNPSAKSAKYVAKKSAKYLLKAIAYPTAFAYIWGKETLKASALALFYTSKTAYKVVSPTIESGFYSIFGLSTIGTSPLTYLSSKGFGLLAQSAVLVSTPIVGLGHGLANNAINTIEGISWLGYDIAKGVGKVFYHTSMSGIKLGYNAVSSIPTHLGLGALNLAYFLSWDGPRLLIHTIKGNDIEKLPAGVVIDMNKIKELKNYQVKEVELSLEEKKEIIKKIPKDLWKAQ